MCVCVCVWRFLAKKEETFGHSLLRETISLGCLHMDKREHSAACMREMNGNPILLTDFYIRQITILSIWDKVVAIFNVYFQTVRDYLCAFKF